MNFRDRRINEGERYSCGERMATILESSSNSSSNSKSTVDTMSVSDVGVTHFGGYLLRA